MYVYKPSINSTSNEKFKKIHKSNNLHVDNWEYSGVRK
jgi:hypothetical protein